MWSSNIPGIKRRRFVRGERCLVQHSRRPDIHAAWHDYHIIGIVLSSTSDELRAASLVIGQRLDQASQGSSPHSHSTQYACMQGCRRLQKATSLGCSTPILSCSPMPVKARMPTCFNPDWARHYPRQGYELPADQGPCLGP